LYRLDDPYLGFWHRFVGPLVRGGVPATLRPELIWDRHVEPGLAHHLGPIFEEVCRDFLRHSTNLPFVPNRVGGWWTHDATEEIDAVALGENELIVAECKWGGVTAGDLRTLQRRGLQLAHELGRNPRIHYALFTASERVDEVLKREADEGRLLLFGARDLFEGVKR